ncbi:MAG: hypothetical protein JJE25_12345, partial [Bacteroidia bacterium]|nr:hypothetical protein [Bacteroidia bacterium]
LYLAVGLLYAFVLYRNDSAFNELNIWLRRGMFLFRTLAVFLISIFLLSPMLKSTSRQVEKPIVIIAQDNSASIAMKNDSSFYKNEYAAGIKKIAEELESKYEVRTYSWSEKVSDGLPMDFLGKETDISGMLDETDNRFLNRNVGAIVLATDGLYNKGMNPLYRNGLLKVPVYTLALGDTTVQRDVLISDVRYNRTSYLNNTFPLEIILQARQCSGSEVILKVSENNSDLFSKNISVNGNNFTQKIPVYLEAKIKGTHHYHITVSSVAGEVTQINNEHDVFVEVIEHKQKILLLSSSSHPDLGAITQAIESNENYEDTLALTENFNGKISDYNMVILYQIPSMEGNTSSLVEAVMKQNLPRLFVLGNQSNIPLFNKLTAGITINGSNKQSNQPQAILENSFSLFSLSNETIAGISGLPPLNSPFGDYKASTLNHNLLTQRIGSVNSGIPLWMFNETDNVRTGIIAGEGLWHWRLYDFMQRGNFNLTNELLTKSIQYLLVKENKNRFKIDAKNIYNENESIILQAEVLDENLQLMNTADVNVTITNEKKNSFPFAFTNNGKYYSLNAGFFPVGDYRYKATAKTGNKFYAAEGGFSVSPVQIEQSETVADHRLLFTLSQKTGGKMFYPNELEKLKDELLKRQDLASVSFLQTKLEELISKKWIFFLILLLLASEWFARKRNGSY